jgi:hypothetical protein
MRLLSSGASAVVSVLLAAGGALRAFLTSLGNESIRAYRPEAHYMRGPGPKWREKHRLDRASAGGA